MWQQASDDQTSCRTMMPTAMTEPPRAASRPGSGLPGWASFAPQDRQLLVHLLVQTARRQLRHRPTVPSAAERG